jgi:thymidylate kinase
VTPEQLNKCRVALFKTFQDEGVKAARAKQAELRKEAEYASDDEKRKMRQDFEDAAEDLRRATKEAMLAADEGLTADVVDKVLEAVEERMKQRTQQFQPNGKKK